MTQLQKRFLTGGLLLAGAGLCLPRVSYALPACNNSNLTGTYNAEISSLSFMSVLSNINGSAGAGSGSTGSASSGSTTTMTGTIGNGASSSGGASGSAGIPADAGSSAPSDSGSTGAVGNPGGFGNNKFSLSNPVQGSGRFYFDGSGNIWGRVPGTSASAAQTMIIGSYSVGVDCRATMTLNSGEHFFAAVADGGAQAVFMQNDANAGGAVGRLTRSVESCINPNAFPQNFAFSLFGAQQPPAATGTTGAATAVNFTPYSAVGEVQLSDNGSFILSEWVYSNGAATAMTATGTYTVSQDCSLQLAFANTVGAGGTTGAFTAPVTFQGSLNRTSSGRGAATGALVVQPQNVTTVVGTFIAQ